MAATETCRRCGAALTARAPAGLCPRCLLESAVRLVTSPDAAAEDAAPSLAKAPECSPPVSGRLGNYELLERIATGGMGVVYRARQLGLNRIVALKVLPFGPFTRDEFVERFQLEASSAARLRHPNIVSIFEVGKAEGFPFFSMEFVEGPTLAELVRDKPLPAERAVRLVRTIAEAVHYAHQQGILHRDLKPSNVLVDTLDQPRVTDFGLAKQLDNAEHGTRKTELTLSGQSLGTPNFMPPEQAEGRHAHVGPRSDVYGLGAILYHLVACRPPFTADSAATVLRQVVQNDPPSPRVLNPSVPRDIETICLRCLEKEPARRYASAQELAEELGRVQRGEPILARPISPPARLWRWCLRRPAIAALLATVLVVFAAGFVATFSQWRRAEHSSARLAETVTRLELDRAEDRLERGETVEALAQLANVLRREPLNRVAATRIFAVLSQRRFLLPTGTVIQDDFVGRNSVFAQHGDWLVTATNRGATLQLWNTREGLRLHRLMPCGEPMRVASFRGDGRQLASATANGGVLVFDINTGSSLREKASSEIRNLKSEIPNNQSLLPSPATDAIAGPHNAGGYIDRILLSPDGAQIIAHLSGPNSDDWRRASIKVIDSVSGRVLRHATNTHWAAFSTDGRRLITISGRTAQLRNPSTWEAIGSPLSHAARINTAEFSADSQWLVTASADNTARLWDTETAQQVGTPLRHDQQVFAAVFSPDGKRLMTKFGGRSARLWDAATGQPAGPEFELTRGIAQNFFSTDSALVVTSSENKVRLRDAATGALVAEPLDTGQTVARARFIGGGRQVLVSTFGGAARVWDVPTRPAEGHRFAQRAEVNAVAVSPDGSRIAAGIRDATARVWDAMTAESIAALKHPSQVTRIAFDSSGTRLVTTSTDPAARVWELPSGRLLGELRHQGIVLDAVFSPDGRWLITCSEDRTARLWNADTLLPSSGPLRHGGDVRTAAFESAGQIVATGGLDNTVRLWRVPDGAPLGEPLRHSNVVDRIAFSPDGQVLTSCGSEKAARLWSLPAAIASTDPARFSVELRTPLLRHESHVGSVEFDPSGERVVTASDDGTVRIWSAPTGASLARPMRHDGPVGWAGFSPDGHWILTASTDGTARVWDAATGHALTDPLRHEGVVTSARWSPHGDFVVTGSDDRTVRVWPAAFLSFGEAPDWLPDLAEAVGGKRLLGDHLHAPVKPAEFLRLREILPGRAESEAHRRWLEDLLGTTRPGALR